MSNAPRIVEVRTRILKRNDELARSLRSRFAQHGVLVVDLVSGPGAGKTELLTVTLKHLLPRLRVAAIVGDLATENDADRLATSGAPTRQIITGSVCHLEADMVERAIAGWNLDEIDVLFIENVGNLVCPASYDLGEDLRVLLFAVTEGEDKPLKYPTLINTCDLVLITKVDLAVAVGFDATLAYANIQSARPGVQMITLSARSGENFEKWVQYLETARGLKAGKPGPVIVSK